MLLLHHGSTGVAECLKSTYGKSDDGGRRQNFKRLNRYNSAADCSISLKFGKLVHCGSSKRKPACDRLLSCVTIAFIIVLY